MLGLVQPHLLKAMLLQPRQQCLRGMGPHQRSTKPSASHRGWGWGQDWAQWLAGVAASPASGTSWATAAMLAGDKAAPAKCQAQLHLLQVVLGSAFGSTAHSGWARLSAQLTRPHSLQAWCHLQVMGTGSVLGWE